MKTAGPTELDIAITPARPEDVPAIATLLQAAQLPHEDFASHLAHFLVARDAGGTVIGAIGAEVYGSDALLRSLVVAPAFRGHGLGVWLVQSLETATAWDVQRWWLLTTTAEAFFKKRDFVVTPRSAAPSAIAATEEFRGLCPSVAVCLSRERRLR